MAQLEARRAHIHGDPEVTRSKRVAAIDIRALICPFATRYQNLGLVVASSSLLILDFLEAMKPI